ncbi:MAG: hypothetical protein ACJ0BI_03405 [Paracoccaceae bacterium]
MRDEDILSKPARILTQEERESFFKDGYVVKKKIISDDWLGKLNEALAKLIEKSKSLTKSDGTLFWKTATPPTILACAGLHLWMKWIQYFTNFRETPTFLIWQQIF